MSDRLNDNVGKKIVEALKMQTLDNTESVSPEDLLIDSDVSTSFDKKSNFTDTSMPQNTKTEETSTFNTGFIDNIFASNLNSNIANNNFSQIQTDFELPNNIAILNHLISKLPSGVSKQTGAVIIRQTMEALGISMNTVMQEAKNVQQNLTDSAKECQRNIIEYRKQISELEVKSQQYQRQAVAMNDVINLFSHS